MFVGYLAEHVGGDKYERKLALLLLCDLVDSCYLLDIRQACWWVLNYEKINII